MFPVVAMLGLIFLMSTDLGSAGHTSRLLEPFFRWGGSILPGDQLHFLIRKAGHLSEYAILGIVLCRALARSKGGWHWKSAGFALLLCALYAVSDEFHQCFVPSRGACFQDVLIDSCGGLIGLIFLWGVSPRRRFETDPSCASGALSRAI